MFISLICPESILERYFYNQVAFLVTFASSLIIALNSRELFELFPLYIYISVFFSLRLLALNSTLLLPYFCGCITFVLRISGCSIIHTWLGGIKFPLSFRLVNGLFTNFFFFFPPNLLSDVPVVGNNLMLTRSCIHVEQCYPYSLLNSCTKLTQHQSDRRKDGLYIKPMSL